MLRIHGSFAVPVGYSKPLPECTHRVDDVVIKKVIFDVNLNLLIGVYFSTQARVAQPHYTGIGFTFVDYWEQMDDAGNFRALS